MLLVRMLSKVAHFILPWSHAHYRTAVEVPTLVYIVDSRSALSRLYPGWHWRIRFGVYTLYSSADAMDRVDSHPSPTTRSAWAFGVLFPMMFAFADVVTMVRKEVSDGPDIPIHPENGG